MAAKLNFTRRRIFAVACNGNGSPVLVSAKGNNGSEGVP